jgi:hypothetical protein
MSKAATNEVRKIRALFFVFLSAGTTLLAIAMMATPFFFQPMRALNLKAMILAACPVVVLLVLSWFWHLQGLQIASEIED